MFDTPWTDGPWVVHERSGPTQPIVVGRAEIGPNYTLVKVLQPQNNKKAQAGNARLTAAGPEMAKLLHVLAFSLDEAAIYDARVAARELLANLIK